MWLWHIATIKERNRTGTIRDIFTELTYMYQGHSVTGSLRLAPVRPEHGMKWMSFLGLKPTFFRKGTSFSLHSSYLQGSSKDGRQHLVRQHTGVSYVRPDCQNCQKCKTAANVWRCVWPPGVNQHLSRLQLTVGSSILLIRTMRCLTPAVLASMACSLVWPPFSKPVSNSPFLAEITWCKETVGGRQVKMKNKKLL